MKSKTNRILTATVVFVCFIFILLAFVPLYKDVIANKNDYISITEGNASIEQKANPTINLSSESNDGNVYFEFTQFISVDDMNGVTPLIDFDLGVDRFESRNIRGIRIDISDSLDESQLLSVGITGRDENPSNVGVSVGLDKGDVGSYSIFYLENSSRTYYGYFPDSSSYVSIGTHFGAYDNGNTSVITGPARFALIYNNTYGNRNVMMKGIYKPETNVGEQKYLIADLDSEDFTRAYYNGETKEIKELFTSGYAKVSLKVYGVTTAKLNIYSIAGQEFDNNGFKNQGPKIYVSAELNSLKNKEYQIPVPSLIYDEIDNDEISEYSVQVLSPDNDLVSTSKESFVPETSGIYVINYTAKDAEDNITVKTLKINCFDTVPEIEFRCDTTINKEYSLGEKIAIPTCTAKSDLSLAYDKRLKVRTIIQGENGVVASFDNDNDRQFMPKSIGVYTVYYVVDNFGLGKIYTGSDFEVTNDTPFIAIEQKDSYVIKGQYFAFDNAYAFYKGEKYMVTPVITSPSGKTVKAQNRLILCTEVGNYSLNYKFEKDGASVEERATIHCYNKADDYFITDRIESVIPSTAIPEFAKQYGKKGLFISTNSVNSSFEFCNKVDLTKLNKDINLFSLVPYADEKDYGMFYLQVELTDANDSSNKVILSVNPHADAVILKQYAYVNVNYDGRTLARSTELNGGIMTSGYHGCLIESSFGTGYGRKDVPPFEIQFDMEENAFYVQTHYGNFGHWQLLDLDDPNQVGAGREWKGFSTGEVYVRFIFNKLNTSKAGVILTEFAGLNLEKDYIVDEFAPVMKVIFPDNYTLNNGKLPDAKVNKQYPLPNAEAYDLICAESDIGYHLFHQDNPNINLYDKVHNNIFIPEQVGKYYYVIKTTDIYGNSVSSEYSFDVTNQDYSIAVTFGDTDSAYAGYSYTLPSISINGGSGVVTHRVSVTLDGKSLHVNANNQVYLDKTGLLKVTVEATDYIGSETNGVSSWEKQVNAYNEPVISVSGVQQYVFYGDDIVLNDFSAINFSYASTEKEYYPHRAIIVDGQQVYSVNGEEITGSLVVKSTKSPGEEVEIKFVTLDENGVITKELISNVMVLQKATYISDFVLTKSNNGAVVVERNKVGSTYSFNNDLELNSVYPVATNNLVISFYTFSERIKVTLTDYYDDVNQLSFEIINVNGSTRLSYKGKEYAVTGSMSHSDLKDLFYLLIDADGSIYDSMGNSLCVLYENDMGEPFTGFVNGGAKVKIDVTTEGNGSFALYQLGNQAFFEDNNISNFKDFSAPEIVVKGSVPSVINKGKTVIIPNAFSYDVLCGISKVTVKVTNAFGQVVKEIEDASLIDGDSFVVSEYGFYTIKYTATDKNNNSSEIRLSIYVKDDEAPTLTVSGSVPTTVNVGSEINFPTATATDNKDNVEVYVLINNPSGSIIMLMENKYTFTEKGNYKIIYYVHDRDYNIVTKIFELTVE